MGCDGGGNGGVESAGERRGIRGREAKEDIGKRRVGGRERWKKGKGEEGGGQGPVNWAMQRSLRPE